jgi:hypothetical protein
VSFEFDDFLSVLDGDIFNEIPVELEEFVRSVDYLHLPPLSELQYKMVRATTQILREDTLIRIYGKDKGKSRWRETHREGIFQLGKGSGKDYCSTIAVAYVVYQLLCMKDPASYFGKPPNDAIDIINIAINAQQAQNVFFKGFTRLIKRSPWFQGKYDMTKGSVAFDKEVTVHSGHSERESWEGYNVIMVILDEIAGFSMENTTGNMNSKTSEEIYNMYAASVSSRFPDSGKIVLLSFPRYKGDFIQTRYDNVVREKNVVSHHEKLMINPDLGDIPENYVEFDWDEDFIISYNEPGVYALKRPSWIMNPTRKITDYLSDFVRNITDALMRFACMPPDAIDGFFKDAAKVEAAFSERLNIEEDGTINEWFQPEEDIVYYIHVDLAQKVDHCAVAMSHISGWTNVRYKGVVERLEPVVVVDFIRYWTPTSDKTVDFKDVRNFIVQIAQKGFNIGLVTFDRWNSLEMMEYLQGNGIKTERLSVAKPHYTDMLFIVNESRLRGPDITLVRKELVQLRVIKDRIDHPRSGSKDLADATCGAIYNAISLTPRAIEEEVEIQTLDTLRAPSVKVYETPSIQHATGPMPDDIAAYLDQLAVI